jgi:hypothetical protein
MNMILEPGGCCLLQVYVSHLLCMYDLSTRIFSVYVSHLLSVCTRIFCVSRAGRV